MITPLLLIPFVENCFKHGTSKMLEHPWIKLQINLAGNNLEFKLTNSKPSNVNSVYGKNGIGLNNVKKRLDLLFPNKHSIIIKEDINPFYVYLKLPLKNLESSEINFNQKSQSEILVQVS